jgi:hypothetical protein
MAHMSHLTTWQVLSLCCRACHRYCQPFALIAECPLPVNIAFLAGAPAPAESILPFPRGTGLNSDGW